MFGGGSVGKRIAYIPLNTNFRPEDYPAAWEAAE